MNMFEEISKSPTRRGAREKDTEAVLTGIQRMALGKSWFFVFSSLKLLTRLLVLVLHYIFGCTKHTIMRMGRDGT